MGIIGSVERQHILNCLKIGQDQVYREQLGPVSSYYPLPEEKDWEYLFTLTEELRRT